jgi:nitroreductase
MTTTPDLAIHPLIAARQSRRAFSAEPLSEATLTALLEAARWAPSCANKQAWRFVVVRTAEGLARLRPALNAGNAWAATAPVLIAVVSRPEFSMSLGDRHYFAFDCGLAVENLLLQGAELELVCHPMAGFDEAKAREALVLPDALQVLVLIAVGYPGNPDALDEATQAKERVPRARKPLAEIVHHERWTGEVR